MNNHKKPNPAGLCGSVAVDLTKDRNQALFDQALMQLRGFGWRIGGRQAQIVVVGPYSKPSMGQAAIILCKSKEECLQHNAINPDGYAILSSLGGGRMERMLVDSVTGEHVVDKVIVGLNWTMVRAGGLCGIARSPMRGTEGARTIRPREGFGGKSLSELAANLCSSDTLRRSVGLAAVNAFWNREEAMEIQSGMFLENGGLSAIEAPGDGVIIIGGFRGAAKRLPAAKIVEREPKPGDISVEEAPQAYKTAQKLAITAQTLMNGSLETILQSSHMVPHRMLVGPSAPLCPFLLGDDINEISGAVIVNADAAEQFIVETGTMIMLDHIAHDRYLRG